jgi:hypothetical protein
MDIAKAFCPECRAPMRIRRLVCPQGHVAMEGEFEVPTLARLSLEEQLFGTAFVRCHGSIKQMEKFFGVSYPTIKNRLNRIGTQLPFAEIDPEPEPERLPVAASGELLSQLERGTLSVDDVLRQLRKPEDRK